MLDGLQWIPERDGLKNYLVFGPSKSPLSSIYLLGSLFIYLGGESSRKMREEWIRGCWMMIDIWDIWHVGLNESYNSWERYHIRVLYKTKLIHYSTKMGSMNTNMNPMHLIQNGRWRDMVECLLLRIKRLKRGYMLWLQRYSLFIRKRYYDNNYFHLQNLLTPLTH